MSCEYGRHEVSRGAAVPRWLVVAAIAALHWSIGAEAPVHSQESNAPGKGALDEAGNKKQRKIEAPPPAHKAVYTQEYFHSFKGERELGPEFHWHGLEPQSCVEFEPQGMRITLPTGHPGKRMGTGIGLNTPVKGDFEITMRYEMLKEPKAAEAGAASSGLFVWVDLQKPMLNRGFVARVTRGGGKQYVVWYHLSPEPPAKAVDVLRPFPANSETGRLRLVRTGSVLCYYVAEGASEEFKLLQQHPFGAEDLQAVRWGGQTGGPEAGLEGRFIDLRIRADGLPELPNVITSNQPPPVSGPGPAPDAGANTGWLAAGLGIGVVLLIIVGVALGLILRKRRVAPGVGAAEPTASKGAALSFSCQDCGKRLKVQPSLVGKKVKCPQCGQATLVPAAG